MLYYVVGECVCNSVWCLGLFRENLNFKDIKFNNEQVFVFFDFIFFFYFVQDSMIVGEWLLLLQCKVYLQL